MTDDEGVNDEFGKLVDRMSDPLASRAVEIVEVAEPATMVEVIVPISVYEKPEVVLFSTIAAYLDQQPRRAVAGISVSYEIRSHNLPHLIATMFLGDPVE